MAATTSTTLTVSSPTQGVQNSPGKRKRLPSMSPDRSATSSHAVRRIDFTSMVVKEASTREEIDLKRISEYGEKDLKEIASQQDLSKLICQENTTTVFIKTISFGGSVSAVDQLPATQLGELFSKLNADQQQVVFTEMSREQAQVIVPLMARQDLDNWMQCFDQASHHTQDQLISKMIGFLSLAQLRHLVHSRLLKQRDDFLTKATRFVAVELLNDFFNSLSNQELIIACKAMSQDQKMEILIKMSALEDQQFSWNLSFIAAAIKHKAVDGDEKASQNELGSWAKYLLTQFHTFTPSQQQFCTSISDVHVIKEIALTCDVSLIKSLMPILLPWQIKIIFQEYIKKRRSTGFLTDSQLFTIASDWMHREYYLEKLLRLILNKHSPLGENQSALSLLDRVDRPSAQRLIRGPNADQPTMWGEFSREIWFFGIFHSSFLKFLMKHCDQWTPFQIETIGPMLELENIAKLYDVFQNHQQVLPSLRRMILDPSRTEKLVEFFADRVRIVAFKLTESMEKLKALSTYVDDLKEKLEAVNPNTLNLKGEFEALKKQKKLTEKGAELGEVGRMFTFTVYLSELVVFDSHKIANLKDGYHALMKLKEKLDLEMQLISEKLGKSDFDDEISRQPSVVTTASTNQPEGSEPDILIRTE